eukprot:CAMPEP_0170068384 /NCGR_PEP_ID=MMETSP0019_2-20121128/7379_1 /TAXON_ID=98059 /ORGANISM="Dinobryon sp., Strain UTEXLB2267" /LENGTH=126 /DNA_ID=CAMNT_0010276015 /DNA_START=379 /DNA_END=755 /DNA_ORIENTATION=+
MSIGYFIESLQVDPLLWSSITELSEMGVNVDLAGFINAGKQDLMHNIRMEPKNSKLRSMEVVEKLSKVIGASTDVDLTRDIKLDGPTMGGQLNANMQLPLTTASMSLGLSSRSFRIPFTSPFTGIP